jgi:hypothetical protein
MSRDIPDIRTPVRGSDSLVFRVLWGRLVVCRWVGVMLNAIHAVPPVLSEIVLSRRNVIVGAVATVAIAAAASAASMAAAPSSGSVSTAQTMQSSNPTQSESVVAPTGKESARAVTAIDGAASVASTADRLNSPLRIDWLGGSDVAWLDVSLPDAFMRQVTDFEGRPIAMTTRIRQAVMADGVSEMVDEAIAAETDAIIMSINLVWLHWDEIACGDITVPHEKYGCLLRPVDPDVSEQRWRELQELINKAESADVPVYAYVLPHSTDVLANRSVNSLVEIAETAIAAYDPVRADVRFVSEVFTRDMAPMVEGADFFDMVHPTEAGAERLVEWLTADITAHWASVGLGR